MALLKAKRSNISAPAETGSSDDNNSDNSEETANENGGNKAWADCMQKLLQVTQKPGAENIVLSRAKKLKPNEAPRGKAKKKKEYDFEIEAGVAGKDEEANDDEKKTVKKEKKPVTSSLDAQLTRQQRKNVPLQLRVKPTYKDMERERSLRKVATRGTVQFFNAVRIQQKDLQQQLAEAGPLDSRQDAVLNNIDKRKFLDVLMSGKRAKSTAIDKTVKKEEQQTDSESDEDEEQQTDDEESPTKSAGKKKSEWNVLREDFMTNKKIKHWDEEDDEQQGEQAGSDANGSNSGDSDDD